MSVPACRGTNSLDLRVHHLTDGREEGNANETQSLRLSGLSHFLSPSRKMGSQGSPAPFLTSSMTSEKASNPHPHCDRELVMILHLGLRLHHELT